MPARPLLLLAALLLGPGLALSAAQSAEYGVSYRAAQDGLAPLTVAFGARVPQGASIRWDFGDGATGQGASPLHTFYLPGTYQVNVEVHDGAKLASGALRVVVRDGGPEHAAITLLHAGTGALFSAEGSRVYAPLSGRWTLDGQPLSSPVVRGLRDGAHVVRLDLKGKDGLLSQEVHFTTGAVDDSPAFEAEVLRLTNDARARGWSCALLRFGGPAKGPLVRNPQLDLAARAQSDAMALHGYFEHRSPLDGSSVGERAHAAGYLWTGVAENIAGGQTTPQQVVDAWLRSPGHCHNLMGEYAEIGLGYAARRNSPLRTYWTQVFGNKAF